MTICGKHKENDDAGYLLLTSLNKLTKGKNMLCDKINQLLAAQNTVKENNEFSDKVDPLQMYISNFKFSKGALGENLLSGSHGAQVVEKQMKPSL